jgi:hypothetical protein
MHDMAVLRFASVDGEGDGVVQKEEPVATQPA